MKYKKNPIWLVTSFAIGQVDNPQYMIHAICTVESLARKFARAQTKRFKIDGGIRRISIEKTDTNHHYAALFGWG